MKMDKEILMFGNIEIEKKNFFTVKRLSFFERCGYLKIISI